MSQIIIIAQLYVQQIRFSYFPQRNKSKRQFKLANYAIDEVYQQNWLMEDRYAIIDIQVHKDYEINKWQIIFVLMAKCQCQKLTIQMTYNHLVLKNISNVQFSNVMELNLCVNQIANIEPLSKIQLPCLQKLNLSNNQITNIRALVKMNLKYLKEIWLDGNKIKEFQCMNHMNFHKIVEKIVLYSWQQKQKQVQTLNWISKMKPLTIKSISCGLYQENRIKQIQVVEMLRNKYKRIEIK